MNNVIRFFSEVKLELSKVVWPSFDEMVGSVIIVLLLVSAFSVYLGAIDLVFYRMAERVF